MTDLIQRIETAPEPRIKLFLDAAIVLHRKDRKSVKWWAIYTMRLLTQARTSAAEMLVPDGWSFSTMRPASGNMCCAAMWPKPKCENEHNTWNGYAAHPSLALLASILKANGYE